MEKSDSQKVKAVEVGSAKRTIVNKRIVSVGLLAVLVLVLIIYLVANHNSSPGKKVVFSVKGKSYNQNEVKNYISFALDHRLGTKDSLSLQAFDYLKREQVAQDLNIAPTSGQIKQAEAANFSPKLSNQLNKQSWIQLVSYDNALQQNLETGNLSTYEGYSYIFWFGQHLETGPVFTVPGFGDPKLIAQDQSYSKNRANYYYSQLKNNKMSPDAVLSAVKKDSKLGVSSTTSYFQNYSSHFGTDPTKKWKDQVAYQDIINYISNQSKTGLSPIETGKIAIANVPKSPKDYANGYYYIVKLDVANKAPNINVNGFSNKVSQEEAQYIGW